MPLQTASHPISKVSVSKVRSGSGVITLLPFTRFLFVAHQSNSRRASWVNFTYVPNDWNLCNMWFFWRWNQYHNGAGKTAGRVAVILLISLNNNSLVDRNPFYLTLPQAVEICTAFSSVSLIFISLESTKKQKYCMV